MQAQALVESLAADPRAEGRRRLLRGIGIASLALVGLVGSAATIWLVVQAMIYGWQTSDWSRLDLGSIVPLPFLLLLFAVALMAARPRARPRRVRPLLDTIAGSDGQLAPLAFEQPEVPDADILAIPTLRFDRLRVLEGERQSRVRTALSLVILPLEGGTVFADALSQLLGGDAGTPTPSGPLRILLGVVMLTAGVLYIGAITIMLLRNRRYVLVSADNFSVSWRRGILHRTRTAHWSAARSFICVTYAPSAASANTRTAYLLDFGDAMLAWEEVPGGRDDELDQVELMTGLVVSRTRLLLRDLTGLTIALRDARHYPESLQHFGLAPDLLSSLRMVGRWSRHMLWLLLPATLLLILGFAIPFVGAQRLEDYQRSYFASLPQKVHAAAPIFFDPLIVFDNRWDVQQPSKDNGDVSIGYRDSTYQMTGTGGNYVYSFADPIYSDAAIEVTAVQKGKAADGNDGVGIMLRADTDQDMVVYYVSPTDGSWSLYHRRYNALHPDDSWIYMDSGTSGYVHTGPGVSNTLLVLARGPTYLLYVNGHFLDAYTDRYHDDPNLPTAGKAGLYVNDGATTGIFSNFSVYPVQSPPSLSYV
ncbi:MAG TPA: hypothetical protein VF116_00470 [Ktedonobacterales bacterium]